MIIPEVITSKKSKPFFSVLYAYGYQYPLIFMDLFRVRHENPNVQRKFPGVQTFSNISPLRYRNFNCENFKSNLIMKKISILTTILMTANLLFAQIINIPADYPTIKLGIDAAGNGDTVLVHPGTYEEGLHIFEKKITLASLFLTTHDTSYISQTVIRGTWLSGCDNVRLCGLTYTAPYEGGGLWCQETSGLMDHLIITGNSNYSFAGGVTIWDCSGDLRFTNVTFSNNTSGEGGGVCCLNSSPVFENCLFLNNNASYGGAVFCYQGSSPVFRNVVFAGNNMESGGNGSVLFMNNFSSNADPCFPSLINCTITGNHAFFSLIGGESLINGDDSSNATVVNSISWYNQDDLNKLHHSTVSYSNVGGGQAGTGNINEDPLFIGAGDHPCQLTTGSPCIDAGTPDTTGLNLPLMDLIGNFRIWDGDGDGIERIDMGAYEFDAPVFVGIRQPEIAKPVSRMLIFPNPFTDQLTIELDLQTPGMVSAALYNHLGQKQAVLFEKQLPAGKQVIPCSAGDLRPGMYFLHLRAGSEKATQKIIKIQ